MDEPVTLLRPGEPSSATGPSGGLPPDLLAQAAGRVGTIALPYACTYFLAGVFPVLLFSSQWRMFFGHPVLRGRHADGHVDPARADGAGAADLARRLDAIALAQPRTPERARAWWDAHLPAAYPPRP